MTPRLRFTITEENVAPDGVVVRQPIGWREAKLILERDPNYNSLVEYFESEFIWYGSAYRLLKQIRQEVGIDAKVQILIELAYRKESWQTIFNGLIPLAMTEEFTKGVIRYKLKAPIIRDDFWAKFINNAKQPIDLLGTTDLDGNARTPVSKTVLPLPSQVIRSFFDGAMKDANLELASITGHYQYNTEEETTTTFNDAYWNVTEENRIALSFTGAINLDEVEEFFKIGANIVEGVRYDAEPSSPASSGIVAALMNAKYSGTYRFQPRLEISIYSSLFGNNGQGTPETREYQIKDNFASSGAYIDLYIQVNDGAPILFDKEDTSLVVAKVATIFTTDQTFELNKGDEVKIFIKVTDISWGQPTANPGISWSRQIVNLIFWGDSNLIYPNRFTNVFLSPATPPLFDDAFYDGNVSFTPAEYDAGSAPSGEENPTRLLVTADTVYEDSQTDSFLLKDAAESILSKITGNDGVITSNALDNIRGKVALSLGKHIRGYEFSEKPFSMSWEEFWKGAKPLAALGLGYVEGQNKIEIEAIESFFVPINSIVLSKIKNFTQEDDEEKLVKLIKYGFEEWSAESASGIDDPQTNKWRRTRFTLIGTEVEIVSTFFTASLGIEQTRRNKIEKGKDYRLDEKIIAIAVKDDGAGGYTPEVGTDFDTIDELLNSNTRYNVRFFTSRIFKRWQTWLQGVLRDYDSEFFYYSKGEGNEKAFVKFMAGDPEAQLEDSVGLAENEDIETGVTGVMSSEVYNITEAPLRFEQYKRIRDNRKNSIGIQLPEGVLPMFIKKLEFLIVKGKFNAVLWRALTGARIFDDTFGPEFN